jgi:hypothetical protein
MTKRAACALVAAALVSGAPVRARADGAETAVDVVLLLDLSASMEKAFRGSGYAEVLQWASRFGRSVDRVAVVTLGERSREVQGLEPFAHFSPATLQPKVKAHEKWSCVSEGLEYAYYMLRNAASPDTARWIFLFSDGEIDLPGGPAAVTTSKRYLREVLLPGIRRAGLQVFAFMPGGSAADYPMLQEITESTGGQYFRGLPVDAAAFRRAQVANWAKGHAPPQVLSKLALPAQVPVASQPTGARSHWVHGLLGTLALAAVAATALLLRSRKRARTRQQELLAILEEVHVLRDELAKAHGSGRHRSPTGRRMRTGN